MPSLAVYETKVRTYADDHNLYFTRGDVRRAAKHLARRQANVLDLDRDMRILGYMDDPTPIEAVRNITDNDRAAARRLGLA